MGTIYLALVPPKDPQPKLWGRKQGQTDHGLTQHSFSYGCAEGRDFTQAAALCSPKTWQEQSSIPPTAQHQRHGKSSLWTNPPSASTSVRRFLSPAGGHCADSHTPFGLFYTENRDTCKNTMSQPASVRDMPGVLIHGKRKGESVV